MDINEYIYVYIYAKKNSCVYIGIQGRCVRVHVYEEKFMCVQEYTRKNSCVYIGIYVYEEEFMYVHRRQHINSATLQYCNTAIHTVRYKVYNTSILQHTVRYKFCSTAILQHTVRYVFCSTAI